MPPMPHRQTWTVRMWHATRRRPASRTPLRTQIACSGRTGICVGALRGHTPPATPVSSLKERGRVTGDADGFDSVGGRLGTHGRVPPRPILLPRVDMSHAAVEPVQPAGLVNLEQRPPAARLGAHDGRSIEFTAGRNGRRPTLK